MKKIYMIVALAFVFTMASFAQGKLLQTKALKYDGKVVKSMKIQKAEAEGDELITPPESAEIQDWTLTGNYISNGTAYTTVMLSRLLSMVTRFGLRVLFTPVQMDG